MVSKRRSVQLNQARAARVYQPAKKRKIDNSTEKTGVNSSFNPVKASSSDRESEEPNWYWNNSSDDEISDSDSNSNSDSDSQFPDDDQPEHSARSNPEPEQESIVPPNISTQDSSLATQPLPTMRQPPATLATTLKWKKGGDAHLRGTWGTGSQSTKERQQRDARER